jgi:cytochrome P450
MDLGQCLTRIILRSLIRDTEFPINMLLPELLTYYIMPKDRENFNNSLILRKFVKEMIEERRKGSSHSSFASADDLLSILIKDPYYEDKNELIVDECIAFFFAGS